MSSPTDDFLDSLEDAVDAYLAAQSPSVGPPEWLRDSVDSEGQNDLDASTHRVHTRRVRVTFEAPRAVGGNARARMGRRTHLVSEIRGDDFADAELLHDAFAWALRQVGGTAFALGTLEWPELQVNSRGVACTLPWSIAFTVDDPPNAHAATEHVALSGALET